MKEQTNRESFATLEDFVNKAKELVKDKNNFSYINKSKYEMCVAKMNINGVYGEAFGIMEDGRILLSHVVKYSVDRTSKKCYSFYRDKEGITNPELARKVERQRRKYPEGLSAELELINTTIENGNLGKTNEEQKKDKVVDIKEYRLRKGVNVPFRLQDSFFRKIRNGYYTKNFVIYDKLGERVLDIKDNVEDFLVKNKKGVIVVGVTALIGISIFAGASYPEPKLSSHKVVQEVKSFDAAGIREKEDYISYLANINRDYLDNDENVNYYIEEIRNTFSKYEHVLPTNNEELIQEVEGLLFQQVSGLRFLISNRLKELGEAENVELEPTNLSYVDGELTNTKMR